MKRKIFLKFFAVVLMSLLLMFVFSFIAVKAITEKIIKERLIEETKIVSLLLNDKSDFEKFKVYEGNSKFRITIIDLDGTVLFESDTSKELENHLDREEIQSALNGKETTITRYSETFECNMTYYAMKVKLDSGEDVILRLAVWSSESASYLKIALPLLVIVLLFALILSLVLSRFISSDISSKVVGIGNSLKSLNQGKYVPVVADESEPELKSVFAQINELNESTHTHILEISREQKKLKKLLENISQGIIAVNDQGEIVFANKSAFDTFKSNENTKNLLDFIKNIELYNEVSAHLFENHTFEYKLDESYLSVTIHEVQKDDIKISSIIIITDITSERLISKQKSEFFANASHELKTPITVMQGLSELLKNDEELNEGAKKRIERIHKESLRLGSLITDMLYLSQLERGEEVKEAKCEVDLRKVFDEAHEVLSEKISDKNIRYTINGSFTILAEEKKIYEIAENLLSNAIRYNKDGGEINVSLTKTDTEGILTVSDTGIGIEKKHIPMLCQRFYRVDKSHSKKTGGTGLGLAIVKHTCALYQASLDIESEIDVGTKFTIKFKLS